MYYVYDNVWCMMTFWLQNALSSEHFLGNRILEVKVATPKVALQNLKLVHFICCCDFHSLTFSSWDPIVIFCWQLYVMVSFRRRKWELQQRKLPGSLLPGSHNLWRKQPFEGNGVDCKIIKILYFFIPLLVL